MAELSEPVLATPPARSARGRTRAVFRDIGPLWPAIVLSNLGTGLVNPGLNFIALNYFAQRHTTLDPSEIHCDISSEAEYCKLAINEATLVLTIVPLFGHALQLVAGPCLGTLSDSWGRRNLIILTIVLSTLPQLFCVCFLWFNTNLVYAFVAMPLVDLSAGSLPYAYMIDKVQDPETRVAAFGVTTGASVFCSMLGTVVALALSLRSASTVALGLCLVLLAYVICFLPESLPPERRRPLSCSVSTLLMPFKTLGILVRTKLLARLSAVVFCSSFLDAGFERISPSYLIKFLHWQKNDGYVFTVLQQAVATLWLAIGLDQTSRLVGEVGAVVLARCCCLLWGASFLLAARPWHVMVIACVGTGPIAMGFPAIQALKSRAVSDTEQGAMQAALSTLKLVAEGLGPAFFGALFVAATPPEVKEVTWGVRSVILLSGACCLPLLVLIATLPPLVRARAAETAAWPAAEETEHSEKNISLQGVP